MGAWDKLTGVNRVLRAGGENPVNTLASTAGDALMAEAILDEVNLEVQAVGLTCNSEIVEYTPDANNEIIVPDEVLHVQAIDTDKLIVQRGRTPTKLYNTTDNTFLFTNNSVPLPLRVRVVTGEAYEDLPFLVQLLIADEAGRRYQMHTQGDMSMDAMLREIWFQSRAKARAQDIRSRGANVFGAWASRIPWRAAKRTNRSFWR